MVVDIGWRERAEELKVLGIGHNLAVVGLAIPLTFAIGIMVATSGVEWNLQAFEVGPCLLETGDSLIMVGREVVVEVATKESQLQFWMGLAITHESICIGLGRAEVGGRTIAVSIRDERKLQHLLIRLGQEMWDKEQEQEGEELAHSDGLFLADRIAGQTDAELLEDLAIDLREHDGGMNLTALEFGKLGEGTAAVLITL